MGSVTRQQTWEKLNTGNKDSSRYPLRDHDSTSYLNSKSAISNIRSSHNLKLPVKRTMYHNPLQQSLLTSAYIYSHVLNIPLRITFLYSEEKLRCLLDYNYYWEDEEMNTFLSLVDDHFNTKYEDSLINPQVVVGDLLPTIVSSDGYRKNFNLNDNIFIFFYLPNKDGNGRETGNRHYVLVSIYKRYQHVSIYRSGKIQESITDELEPKLKSTLNEYNNILETLHSHYVQILQMGIVTLICGHMDSMLTSK